MSCPFKPGQRWVKRYQPEIQAVICRVLTSRERRNFEAWARTDWRHDGVDYPFDADDPTRSRDILIDVLDWIRLPNVGAP